MFQGLLIHFYDFLTLANALLVNGPQKKTREVFHNLMSVQRERDTDTQKGVLFPEVARKRLSTVNT